MVLVVLKAYLQLNPVKPQPQPSKKKWCQQVFLALPNKRNGIVVFLRWTGSLYKVPHFRARLPVSAVLETLGTPLGVQKQAVDVWEFATQSNSFTLGWIIRKWIITQKWKGKSTSKSMLDDLFPIKTFCVASKKINVDLALAFHFQPGARAAKPIPQIPTWPSGSHISQPNLLRGTANSQQNHLKNHPGEKKNIFQVFLLGFKMLGFGLVNLDQIL